MLVGTQFMRVLAHFTLALGWDRRGVGGSLSNIVRMALIWGAAVWRGWVDEDPPVIMRLPFAVHLTVASCTCGSGILLNPPLSVRQMSSGFIQFLELTPKCARSTTRLGFGGLDPAAAEYTVNKKSTDFQ